MDTPVHRRVRFSAPVVIKDDAGQIVDLSAYRIQFVCDDLELYVELPQHPTDARAKLLELTAHQTARVVGTVGYELFNITDAQDPRPIGRGELQGVGTPGRIV